MKIDNKIWIALGVGVVILLGVLIYNWSGNARYSWFENYINDSDGPYGLEVSYKLLEDYYPDFEFIVVDTPFAETMNNPELSMPANYIAIGNKMYMDSISVATLLDFVDRGNNAFLAVKQLPYYLEEAINFDGCYEWEGYYESFDTMATMKLYHPNLQPDSVYNFHYVYKDDSVGYNWLYFNTNYWCADDLEFAELGTFNDSLINFFRVKHGEGYFYFYTTPLVFTNYFMIDRKHAEYAEKTFSHLAPGDIIWDEMVKDPMMAPEDDYRNPPSIPTTPLRFILSEPGLKWAWYITILGVIIYTLFHIKRRQKAIPVIEPHQNTSLEFVQTIGDLYFQQNDHHRLSVLKMKHFMVHIRQRYRINTSVDDQTKLIEDIARKAEVPEKIVTAIFRKYNFISQNSTMQATHLIEFHRLINHFYKSAK